MLELQNVNEVEVKYDGDQILRFFQVDEVKLEFDDQEQPKSGVMTVAFSANDEGNLLRMGIGDIVADAKT